MEWKVYFEDNPGCHRRIGAPGQEVSCGAHSVWAGSISSSLRFTFVEKGWL